MVLQNLNKLFFILLYVTKQYQNYQPSSEITIYSNLLYGFRMVQTYKHICTFTHDVEIVNRRLIVAERRRCYDNRDRMIWIQPAPCSRFTILISAWWLRTSSKFSGKNSKKSTETSLENCKQVPIPPSTKYNHCDEKSADCRMVSI